MVGHFHIAIITIVVLVVRCIIICKHHHAGYEIEFDTFGRVRVVVVGGGGCVVGGGMLMILLLLLRMMMRHDDRIGTDARINDHGWRRYVVHSAGSARSIYEYVDGVVVVRSCRRS